MTTPRPPQPISAEQAISTLYRAAAQAVHPDHGGDTAAMQRVNAAAELLRSQSAPVPIYVEPCRRPHVQPPTYRLMPWGKHKGQSMADVPLSYLSWLTENATGYDVREAARTWLHWRTR